jgi:hypothetical protein
MSAPETTDGSLRYNRECVRGCSSSCWDTTVRVCTVRSKHRCNEAVWVAVKGCRAGQGGGGAGQRLAVFFFSCFVVGSVQVLWFG